MRGKERERLIYAVMVKEPNVVNLLVQNWLRYEGEE